MGCFESSCESESNHLFSLGTEVEVSSDEPGFKGSCYLATIIELPTPKKLKKARVEYRTLLTDDGSEQLKEYVDQACIRPLPPQEVAAQDLEHGEVVGAYCRDGWWTGVVVKVLGNSKYRVFFENPPDVIEFDRKDLRVHLEWVKGKWVRPEKRQETGSIFSSGMDVEVNVKKENLCDAWFPAILIKDNRDDTFLVKYGSSRNGVEADFGSITVDFLHIRLSPPPPHADKKYDVLEKVDAFCDFAWRAGVIARRITDTRYLVYFKHANEDRIINQSEIRPRVVWKDGKWVSRYQEVLLAPDIQEHLRHAKTTSNPEGTVQVESSGGTKDDMGNETPLSANSIKNLIELSSPGDEKEAQYTLTQSTKKMKLPTTPQGNSTDSHPSKKLITRKTAGEMLFAAECKLRKQRKKISTEAVSRLDTANSGGKKTRHSEVDGNKPSAVDATEVWPKQQKHSQLDSEKTTPGKRKRRLSMKLKVKSPSSSASGGGTAKEIVCKGASKDTGMPIIIGLEAKGTGVSDSGNCGQLLDQKKNTNSPTEDRPMEIDQQKSGGNSIKRKRGRPRKVVVTDSKASEEGKEQNGAGGAADGTVKEDCPTQGVALDVLIGEKSADPHDVSTTNDVGSTSVATSGNMDDDDQPLSKWFVGMLHCPTSIKESKLSPGRTIDECEEAREQVDIVQQVPAADATACMLDENRRLPFVKSSPVWKAIESMEIFRIMPQNPHFLPLDKCKEEYREGLAIGNMVTFASLVEKISKLRLDDPRSTFDGYLESLLDLEKHGFDLTVVRGRINELLSIKDGQGRILSESKDVECKILHCNREKTEMAEEMANITEQMAELQKKQALIKSELRNKKQEISRLQIRVDAINRDIQSGRLDFEKVAAAPWKLG
ncbi:hypothetical protein I3843_07G118600 [Carya illinoinensis]|uniref:Agenet domain-containing protein n=2 Tax=Carya illinoinensis TaxID=32201 RepID=A0A8T1Q0P0_CARIL|nr:DUF724 domain-containing protein 2-like isoform X2 [Carya illinoinensis]KAG6648038.1 hypothetical protein CIPAW_07G120400 [Carya illinoinensis]KAG7971106.1 hypothetical protein I3843_07G118600 [Carya illinoinensis]